MPQDKNVAFFQNVQIVFRNFEGKEGQYNRAGERNFAVLLDEEQAAAMLEDGWNVKYLKIREDDLAENPDQVPQAYLQISLGYSERSKPPKVCVIGSSGKKMLDESNVNQLDWVDIENVDLSIRPYHWEVNGNTGTKAYLQSIYVTIEEDELDRKYADIEETH